ncbi:MAG: LCP family protein [Ruminococcus sp.]|nr:LCP family protein [Ruminococcus sp.]
MPDNKKNTDDSSEMELEDIISAAINAKKKRAEESKHNEEELSDADAVRLKRQKTLEELTGIKFVEEEDKSKLVKKEKAHTDPKSEPEKPAKNEKPQEEKNSGHRQGEKQPGHKQGERGPGHRQGGKPPARKPGDKQPEHKPGDRHPARKPGDKRPVRKKPAAVPADGELAEGTEERPRRRTAREDDINLPARKKRPAGENDQREEKDNAPDDGKLLEPVPVIIDDDDEEMLPGKKSGEDAPEGADEPDTGDKPKKKPQGSGKNKKKKKKKWNKKQKTIFTIGVLFIILCLLGVAVYLIFHYYYGLLGGEWNDSITHEKPVVSADASSKEDTFDPRTEEEKIREALEAIKIDLMKDSEVFNILLVGQDLRSTSGETRGNTDVMMLISLNHKKKTITMTSFMRDIWLYIPPCDYSERLNAAYYAGGPEYLRDTLQSYFGIGIDRYVVVTFNQFIDIVDTLGGLDLYVTPDEANGYQGADPNGDNTRGMQNPLDEQNYLLKNKKKTDYIKMDYDIDGKTLHLNGNQALAYSRIRHVDYIDKDGTVLGSDFGRTKRQRIVISEMIKKAKSASLVTLNDLAHKVLPQTFTDISEGEAASLVLNILDYVEYDVQQFRVPEEGTYSGHWIDRKSVILCNTVKNAQDLQTLIYGQTNITEEELKKFAQYNQYYDDNGNYVDYANGIVNY